MATGIHWTNNRNAHANAQAISHEIDAPGWIGGTPTAFRDTVQTTALRSAMDGEDALKIEIARTRRR
jgi:hypothetical protein